MGAKEKANRKTYQVEISVNAHRNIDEITGFIAFINQQPQNAINVGNTIFETIDKIALNPFVFRECEELPTKNRIYRKAVCMSWHIIYKVKGDFIYILGIIHESRKPSKIKRLRRSK